MSRLALVGTFLLLLAALFFLWRYRFERVPEHPVCRLADFREMSLPVHGVEWFGPESATGVRVKVDQANSPVVLGIVFPAISPVDFLHVRFRMNAFSLIPGNETWENGRCIVDWLPRGGGVVEHNPVASVRGDDAGEITEWVIRPNHPPATPILRLEHLGVSGEFELTDLEVTVIRETLLWKIGRWLVLGAWLGWAYCCIVSFGVTEKLRALLAAVVWLVMGIFFVVPGPWKNLRPLIAPFEMGREANHVQGALASKKSQIPDHGLLPVAVPSVGNIPLQGDITLKIKFYFSKLRPMLHSLLLFAPAFLITLLVGWRPALVLTALFALAIEGAQAAFGYGFDWIDLSDLVSDSIGIGVGLVFGSWVATRLALPEPQRVNDC